MLAFESLAKARYSNEPPVEVSCIPIDTISVVLGLKVPSIIISNVKEPTERFPKTEELLRPRVSVDFRD